MEGLARKPERLRDWWEKIGSHRRKFRSRLDELVNDRDRAISKRQSASIKILRRELTIGTRLDDKGDPIHRFIPWTIEAAYEYVLQKLYNKENQTWKRLRECSHCRSYFLRSAGGAGGRPRDYCTPECQKKSDQKNALIRQRKARQRKSK